MKQLLLTLTLLLATLTASAQDVLITKEGEAIKVYDIEVTNESVYYKLEDSQKAPINKISKSELLLIKYKDGKKEVIGDEKQSEQSTQNQIDIRQNDKQFLSNNYAVDVQYIGEKENKPSNLVYCQCELLPNSMISDDKAELIFKSSPSYVVNDPTIKYPQGNCIEVHVKNNSNKTIYVDLGNTFLISGSESAPCYVPTATTSTQISSRGAGVNLGAVADAAGVGGALGKLANGVNVGGEKSNSTSTTIFSQRIIAIPPMTEHKIGYVDFFNIDNPLQIGDGSVIKDSQRYTSFIFPKDKIPNIGETVTFTKNQNLKWGTILTYSEDENQTKTTSLNAMFTLSKIIGTKAKKSLEFKYLDSNVLTPNFLEAIYFLAVTKSNK